MAVVILDVPVYALIYADVLAVMAVVVILVVLVVLIAIVLEIHVL